MAESWVAARKVLSRWKLGKPLLRFRLVAVAGILLRSAGGAETQIDSFSPKLAEPKFSILGGLYSNAVSIELSANSPPAVVRYTLDGSEPTSASPEYSSPISISESTLLKAKVFGSGSSASSTATEAYSFMESGLAAFSSNLPLVVLDTFGQ